MVASAPTASVVYVVDDDDAVLGSLQFLLETDGFHVRTFRTGAALLNGILGDIDCFVIDYKMPTISGIDLAIHLRSQYAGTPIILITGYPEDSIEEKAAAVGIRHVLQKPHLEENLVSRVRTAIEERLAGRRRADLREAT